MKRKFLERLHVQDSHPPVFKGYISFEILSTFRIDANYLHMWMMISFTPLSPFTLVLHKQIPPSYQ